MRAAALPAALLLAACAAEKAPEPAPTPTPTRAVPRTLIPANFDPARLGAHVAGMEVADAPVGGRKSPLATVTAFVACEKDVADCDPAKLPPDTVYTYVLTITPAEVSSQPTPTETAQSGEAGIDLVQPVAPEELVRTARPVPQFQGVVGFALEEAAAALGGEDALSVTLDANRLIWRVTRGTWQPGLPITLWWQSARAPAKPASAYRLEIGGRSAAVTAPFPAADKPVERGAAR